MPNDSSGLVGLVKDKLLPIWEQEKTGLDRIDRWARWDHDNPFVPRASTREYQELIGRSTTPWLSLVVTSTAQSLYVEGYRTVEGENADAWRYWQRNGLDRRQMALHRAAIQYGASYAVALPGKDPITNEDMPVFRGYSPRKMVAFYGEDLDADYPEMAMSVEVSGDEKRLKLFLPESEYPGGGLVTLVDTGDGLRVTKTESHGSQVCPVVRFANMLDLEGRATGEVEPYIEVAARIDQTTFDRLLTQRFNSWMVRWVTGMAQPDTDEEANVAALRLRQEDLLVGESPDTKFGSLPATPLDGFIEAKEADVRDLAAVSQTPPHHLLGQVSNLSAEALAAAEATLARKVEERRHSFGESWEQWLRLAASVDGNEAGAQDVESQVRWRDVESRSLAQTADALGKLAQMLQVPPQALWERIPGVTQQDVEAWKAMAEDNALDLMMQEVRAGLVSPEPGGIPGGQPSEADAGTGLV